MALLDSLQSSMSLTIVCRDELRNCGITMSTTIDTLQAATSARDDKNSVGFKVLSWFGLASLTSWRGLTQEDPENRSSYPRVISHEQSSTDDDYSLT